MSSSYAEFSFLLAFAMTFFSLGITIENVFKSQSNYLEIFWVTETFRALLTKVIRPKFPEAN